MDEAVVRLENSPSTDTKNKSVLEKLLKVDRKVAVLMAFDMLLAGVDTVLLQTSIKYYLYKNLVCFRRHLEQLEFCTAWP